jgi:hypothetical protein
LPELQRAHAGRFRLHRRTRDSREIATSAGNNPSTDRSARRARRSARL